MTGKPVGLKHTKQVEDSVRDLEIGVASDDSVRHLTLLQAFITKIGRAHV